MPTTLVKCALEIDTSAAPPAERLDLFRSWHADMADIELLGDDPRSFSAREQAWRLGEMLLVTVEYSGEAHRLRWSFKQNPTLDHWVLSAPLQRSREASDSAGLGRLRLHCLAVPGQCESAEDATLALIFPNDVVGAAPPTVQIREDTREFLSDYLLLLYRSIAESRSMNVPHIVSATSNLLAMCLSPTSENLARAQQAIDVVVLKRVKSIVRQNLSDKDLTPDRICRDLGLSRSRLYRIFEPFGGVANYIRRERLLKTRETVGDPNDRRPISAIAEDLGFSDPSTYSRMFRKEFGITPKEARISGWQGIKGPEWLSDQSALRKTQTLADLLVTAS